VLHGARIGFPCMVPARFRMLVVRGTAWWVSRDAALSPRFSFRFLLFDSYPFVSGSSIEFASGSLGPLPGLFGRHEWRYRLAMGIRIALLLLRVRARERERERERESCIYCRECNEDKKRRDSVQDLGVYAYVISEMSISVRGCGPDAAR
jgi:hypothetical protein